jgi:hypothetical protein
MIRRILFAVIAAVGVAWMASDVCAIDLPTAKQAVALANAKVNLNTRDLVISIDGTDSDSDLRPRQWDITFYDDKRMQGGTLVRVKDGAAVSKSASVRLFDDARWSRFGRNFTGYDASEIINVGRWSLDSDKTLSSALAQPELEGLQVTSIKLLLRKPSDGDVAPVWWIHLRARSIKNPKYECWIGYLQFDAETGKLLADELRTESLPR